MSTFVLTRPENAKSAVKLGWPTVTDFTQIPANAKVIRWGDGISIERSSWTQVLNKKATLGLSTDKPRALEALARVVKTPPLYHYGQTLPRGHRYVVRPANHAEGSDFAVVQGGHSCNGDHATLFIEDTREYRVWFIRDKYLCAKRVPRSAEGQTASDPCRSKWGYEFQTGIFPKLKEEMGKARLAIPLDFGAVDVLWTDDFQGSGTGAWVFLEFNSAPSLDSDKVLRHFQMHLKAILATVEEPDEIQAEQPAPERPRAVSARPSEPAVRPSHSVTWEEKLRTKLKAEKAAREKAIYNEVYGDLE